MALGRLDHFGPLSAIPMGVMHFRGAPAVAALEQNITNEAAMSDTAMARWMPTIAAR